MDAEAVERVAVVGAGPTGRGVAEAAALGGMTVALRGLTAADATEGRERVGRRLDGLVERGRLREDAAEAALTRVETHADLADASPTAISAVRGSLQTSREASADALDAEAETFGRLAVTDEARAALRAYREGD